MSGMSASTETPQPMAGAVRRMENRRAVRVLFMGSPEVNEEADFGRREPGADRRVLLERDLCRAVATDARHLRGEQAVGVVNLAAHVAHPAVHEEGDAPVSEVEAEMRVAVVVAEAVERAAREGRPREPLGD